MIHTYYFLLIIFCTVTIDATLHSSNHSNGIVLAITYEHNSGYKSPSIACSVHTCSNPPKLVSEQMLDIRDIPRLLDQNPDDPLIHAAALAHAVKNIPFSIRTDRKTTTSILGNYFPFETRLKIMGNSNWYQAYSFLRREYNRYSNHYRYLPDGTTQTSQQLLQQSPYYSEELLRSVP